MKTVVVAGGFDPLHIGHLDHIRKARTLGDRLIVLVCPNEVLFRKKGYCLVPLADRVAVVSALPEVDEVRVGEYTGTSPLDDLREIRPAIYAKGGDRTPDNMLQAEIDVCREIGCEIVYGVGDTLNSSTRIFRSAMRQFLGYDPQQAEVR